VSELACGDCGRFECDACRQAYLRRVTEMASSTASQVLAGLKGLTTAFVAGLQEGGVDWSHLQGAVSVEEPAADEEPPVKHYHWCCNGNAEECALCDTGALPYPWICPRDHEDTPANRKAVLAAAAERGKEAVKDAMARLRVHDAAVKLSKANPRLAEEPLVEKPICELPHETIDEEEACDRLRDAARRRREVIVQPEGDEPLDAEALRALVSREVLRIAVERTEREWICCDPVVESHELCRKGEATVKMLTALLTDDEKAFPARSDVLDAIMRFVMGADASPAATSVLSEAELRELYFKALTRGYKAANAGAGAETVHKLVDAVLETRDRELRRTRQRLLLAADQHKRAVLAEMPPAVNLGAERNKARLEGRIEMLNEVTAMLRAECSSPFESIAYNNPFVWLRKRTAETKKALDERSSE